MSSGKAQILLVDDDAVQASTRSAILARCGADVLMVSRAKDALLLIENPEVRRHLNLIVTDHLMPEMNGPQLVERLREVLPTLPVLVLSGLADAESEYEHLDVTFRIKPFPPDELIRLCRALMTSYPALRSA